MSNEWPSFYGGIIVRKSQSTLRQQLNDNRRPQRTIPAQSSSTADLNPFYGNCIFSWLRSLSLMFPFIALMVLCTNARAADNSNASLHKAIEAGLDWAIKNPSGASSAELLELSEEIIAFNFIQSKAKNDQIAKRARLVLESRLTESRAVFDELSEKDSSISELWFLPSYLAIIQASEKSATKIEAPSSELLMQNCDAFESNVGFSTYTLWCWAHASVLAPSTNITTRYEAALSQSLLFRETEVRRVFDDSACANSFASEVDVYEFCHHLSHDLYAITLFGQRPAPREITSHGAYIALVLDYLVRWGIVNDSLDVVCQAILANSLLNRSQLPTAVLGVEFLASCQNEDGSFRRSTRSSSKEYARHNTLLTLMTMVAYVAKNE